jgi:hypothetical protein
MTHGPKKSDLAEVAMKPTNNAGLRTAAEPVERRVGAEGNDLSPDFECGLDLD